MGPDQTVVPAFRGAARAGAVYNLGGGRANAISMLEAIEACGAVAGREVDWAPSDQARIGDHRWWISDLAGFTRDYPGWVLSYDLERTLHEIHDFNVESWMAEAPA